MDAMAKTSATTTENPTAQASKNAPVKRHICRNCSRSFSTAHALADHRFSTGHYPVHCSVCNKGFGSDEALAQHAHVHSRLARNINRHAKAKQNDPEPILRTTEEIALGMAAKTDLEHLTAMLSLQGVQATNFNHLHAESSKHQHLVQSLEMQLSPQTDALVHKSRTYTSLPLYEQEILYAALLAACHSSERLRAEQFTMPGQNKCRTNTSIRYSEFRETPRSPLSPVPGPGKRKVVAIDCEMVGINRDKDCVVILSAVDVLTGETLLNTYVDPMVRVNNWRTRYSGVTPGTMKLAIKQGGALRGWRAARQALWEYIDAETILVGHALFHDLNVLGMFHSRVVDSAILSAQAVFPDVLQSNHFPRRWGLKKLSDLFLGLLIQTGKKGHDCLEDTLATREVVLWCLRYPERLSAWAKQARLEYEIKLLEKKKPKNEEIQGEGQKD